MARIVFSKQRISSIGLCKIVVVLGFLSAMIACYYYNSMQTTPVSIHPSNTGRSYSATWIKWKYYIKALLFQNDNSVASARNNNSTIDLTFHHLDVYGSFSFHNVCVEETIINETTKSHRIVVYNDFNESGNKTYEKCLRTDSAIIFGNFAAGQWNVSFRSGPIPKRHRVLKASAYFTSPVYLQNLHHFWHDLFVRLYSVIKSTNRLHPGMNNQILYSVRHLSTERTKYEDILRTLYTNEFHDHYSKLPTNTCFGSAVFGARNTLKRDRDAVEHVLSGLNINQRSAVELNDNMVIIRRDNRQILNIDALVKAAESVGFQNVRIVSFENMISVKEQMTLAANTRIMVGVQGAGLQWAIFMPRGSSLIEFSWPQKYWSPYYESVKSYDINYISMAITDVRANRRAFEILGLNNEKLNETYWLKLLNMNHSSVWNLENIWKHADVAVDVDAFIDVIKPLKTISG